jgi:hypothetical protein
MSLKRDGFHYTEIAYRTNQPETAATARRLSVYFLLFFLLRRTTSRAEVISPGSIPWAVVNFMAFVLPLRDGRAIIHESPNPAQRHYYGMAREGIFCVLILWPAGSFYKQGNE